MNKYVSASIKKKYCLKPLPSSFYSNSSVTVAKELLGKYFYSHQDRLLGRIVETEAYPSDDPINHGRKKKTKSRTAMFLPSGYCYVYYVYFKNLCFNISVEKKDTPSVVLLRAIEPLEGFQIINNLLNGPSKLCKAMGVSISDNGKKLSSTHFRIYDGLQSNFDIIETSRIGVKEYNPKPYRFYVKDNPFVSKKRTKYIFY